MATHGRKNAIAKPAPPARDPRDDDGSKDVNPFGGGNPLLTKETESEPIIWDRGDEEEEYPFVNEYPSFKEEPIMFVEDESCPVYDIDNEEDEDGDEEEVVYTDNEEESEVIYDTDGNDVDDSPEFKLLHPDQGELLVIQQVLSVAPSKSIDDNSCRRNNIFCTKCTSKYKVCKMIIDGGSCENVVSTYMVEKLAKIVDHPDPYQLIWLRKGKTIKVRGRVIIMKGNLMQGIQMWMLRVKGTSEANSRTSFFQVGENDADMQRH
ncbi:hypothetical protein Tco_1367374 [Tanacetum coccineum]